LAQVIVEILTSYNIILMISNTSLSLLSEATDTNCESMGTPPGSTPTLKKLGNRTNRST
jgi:hypothetical protein